MALLKGPALSIALWSTTIVDLSTDPSAYEECLTSVAATTSGAGSWRRALPAMDRAALKAGVATRAARAARKAGLVNMIVDVRVFVWVSRRYER